MENFVRDVRLTFRQLRANPGFALIAILSLALGIGANTTIFSAAHGILQRELPVPAADRLARVYRGDHSPLPLDEFLALAEATASFGALTAERLIRVGLSDDGRTEAVQAALVSANYFSGLGIGAQRGRLFGNASGAEAVLSDRYWRARFGADPSVIGRTLRLADNTFTVVGIVEPSWVSSQSWRPDVFVPLSEHAALLGVAPGEWNGSVYVTGRLAGDRTREQAQAEIEALATALHADDNTAGHTVRYSITPAEGIPQEVRAPATLASIFLLALVGLVLLIACANVANLLLARTAFRGREIAIRLALGVTRGRLVRQLLTESLVLALVAGIAAVGVALMATRFLASLLPADLPIHLEIAPDTTVLLFTAGLSLLTGLLCGLAPALRSSRSDLQSTLRQDTSRSGFSRSRLRSAFLVAQVALGTVLLTGAMLFARSLHNAQDMDPGFITHGVVDLPIDVSLRSYDEPRGRAYYDQVLERIRSTPGVHDAALANIVPLSGSNRASPVQAGDADANDPAAFVQANLNTVTPGYFTTLGIGLRAGREFTASDQATAPAVVVINEAAAAALWPGESPVGKVLREWDTGMPEYVVVGVAADAKYNTLGEGRTPFVYLAAAQDYRADMVLHARIDPGAATAVREAVQSIDPALPLDAVRPIESDMSFALAAARLGAGMLGTFALLAMLLASVGIYGVTSWMVARRTPEIGIRSALGAQKGDVLRLVMGETMRVVAVGLLIGITGGAALGRLVSSQLYGVTAIDPVTFIATPLLLLAVAALATWLPARRALSIDPVRALGRE